jgi:hypothetical protein
MENEMKHPGEYTKTQYKRLHGNQWKITERKIAMCRYPEIDCHYFLIRTYNKKVDGEWVQCMGFRFNYPKKNEQVKSLYFGRILPKGFSNDPT